MPADPDRTLGDSDEPLELPADDTELIAYLDGELDDTAAAAVEQRLARDPAARAAAEAYKKSFDLLDYLPKPEPTPDFTARTVTRLQPAVASQQFPVAPSGSVPMLPPTPRRAWPELVAWAVAAVLVLVLGYVGHSVARPLLHRPPPPDEPTLADLEVIVRLPLYLGVDDLAFLKQLDAAELFADDTPVPVTRPHEPSADERAKLIALFRSLPPARQQQLRVLHNDLNALDPKAAPSARATLDAYAGWLDRLPDADRKKVLGAATPAERLDAVRQVKEAQWRATLTPRQKDRLKEVQSTEERLNLVAEFREQEKRRRDEWTLAQHQWQALSEKGQKPWPFSDEKLTRQIDGFVKSAFGTDLSVTPPANKQNFLLPLGCRLTREQFFELKVLHDAAERDGYYLSYGACLLRLSDLHPTLPLPKDGRPVVNLMTVPFGTKLPPNKDAGPKGAWLAQSGKWPEFALQLTAFLKGRPKYEPPPFGPCKPGDFTDDVNTFLTGTLLPKLTPEEKKALDKDQAKWPEYPRAMIELAKKHDLSVPGVMLPGEPSKWNALYRLPAGKK